MSPDMSHGFAEENVLSFARTFFTNPFGLLSPNLPEPMRVY